MISPLFSSHTLNRIGYQKVQQVKESFNNLLQELQGFCYPGREFSIVCTKLEEAAFFAVKSVAAQKENQEDANSYSVRTRTDGLNGIGTPGSDRDALDMD